MHNYIDSPSSRYVHKFICLYFFLTVFPQIFHITRRVFFLLMMPYLGLQKNSALMFKQNRNRLLDCLTQMFILIVNLIFLIHLFVPFKYKKRNQIRKLKVYVSVIYGMVCESRRKTMRLVLCKGQQDTTSYKNVYHS